ncbi:FCP1-like proteiny domain-containing protein [Mycena venus]|uniref:FCP1-like proteiny domain-containing protein n=1 Tax=Mycena venus TaxID=2733690 RepID=A0A8H6YIW4_9AGAR|nr:FCP1-like proteiny domain-containing protein [Mycena venus]
MASPAPALPADSAPAASPDKPLRQPHAAENSGSTSSEYLPQFCPFLGSSLPTNDPATLAGEPPISADDQGQAPKPGPADPSSMSVASPPDDKEQGSLNTTLTGNHKRTTFYGRRGNKSSTSQAAVSSSTSHSIVKPTPNRARSKPKFFARVVYKLVPCVHDSNTMATDVDEALAPQMVERRQSEAGPQTATSEASATDTTAVLLAPPTINVERPPSRADSEIIVQPPPSTQLLPEEETDGLTSGAVTPPGSTGEIIARTHTRDSSEDSDGTSYTDDDGDDRRAYDEHAEEQRLIKNGGAGIPIGPDGNPKPLLPPIAPEHAGRKCLVLDLDETLVHSSFKPIPQPDFIVPVEIEFHWHHFHVLKRPGVEDFLRKMGEIYEIVVFTASLSKYADPVLDKLDTHQVVAHRLYRESCFSHKGIYVKDLSQLGRPIADTIILDNSPASYIFHTHNAVPVSSWFNDPHDVELTDLVPFLADLASVPDVRGILNLTI